MLYVIHLTFECFPFALLPPSDDDDPPCEPAVEAPAKPLLSDEEDEITEDHPDEAHYDSLEKTSTTSGDFWALLNVTRLQEDRPDPWAGSLRFSLSITTEWKEWNIITAALISVSAERKCQ